MSAAKLLEFKKEKRVKIGKVDLVTEQVKKMLTESDQKLILMVRN